MFIGSYRHHVDNKGRVAVPAQLRKGLNPGSVIGIGQEGRIVVWPQEEWQAVQDRYRLTSETPAAERKYMRFLYANSREVELDAQGRLLLSPEHRQFAQIKDRAVFVGVGSSVEIVGEEVWDGEVAALTPDEFTTLGDRINQHPGSLS